MNAQGISLEVKGGGKNSFIRHWTTVEQHGDATEIVNHSEKMKHAKKFMSYK